MVDAMNALVVRAQNAWYQLREGEDGQTLVEYALIIAIVSLGSVLALGFLSGRIQRLFSTTGNQLNDVPA